jgi:hypothetical protein
MEPQREELHQLVDELPPAQVAAALAAVRAAGRQAEPSSSWPPAWFGAVPGSASDVSERVDEILRDGLGRRPA